MFKHFSGRADQHVNDFWSANTVDGYTTTAIAQNKRWRLARTTCGATWSDDTFSSHKDRRRHSWAASAAAGIDDNDALRSDGNDDDDGLINQWTCWRARPLPPLHYLVSWSHGSSM